MKKKIANIYTILIAIIFIISIGYVSLYNSKARYHSNTESAPTLKIATWNFLINNEVSSTFDIDLKNTLSELNPYSTEYVIPGTYGVIPVTINTTGTKVALTYEISIDFENTTIPDNLKFYSDENFTTELTTIEKYIDLENHGEIVNNIYWKWNFSEENETLEWAAKDIKVKLNISAKQKISGDA